MSLNRYIEKSAEWLNKCQSIIDGATLKASPRNRISAGLLSLALEHHGAIQLLTNTPPPHYGSASALLRPQFEAFIRGVWFHRCASKEEIDNFITSDEVPGINTLIGAIEALPEYDEGLVKKTNEKAWKPMCGFTHGGFSQAYSQNNASTIESNYTDEQIYEIIKSACAITLTVSIAFAQLSGNTTMMSDILQEYKELFPEQPA